jgi:hypothetical protein
MNIYYLTSRNVLNAYGPKWVYHIFLSKS